jgi:hypothetical protein
MLNLGFKTCCLHSPSPMVIKICDVTEHQPRKQENALIRIYVMKATLLPFFMLNDVLGTK